MGKPQGYILKHNCVCYQEINGRVLCWMDTYVASQSQRKTSKQHFRKQVIWLSHNWHRTYWLWPSDCSGHFHVTHCLSWLVERTEQQIVVRDCALSHYKNNPDFQHCANYLISRYLKCRINNSLSPQNGQSLQIYCSLSNLSAAEA